VAPAVDKVVLQETAGLGDSLANGTALSSDDGNLDNRSSEASGDIWGSATSGVVSVSGPLCCRASGRFMAANG